MKKIHILMLLAIVVTSCIDKPEILRDQQEESARSSEFDFKSTVSTDIQVLLQDINGEPFKGVKVNIWTMNGTAKDRKIFTAFTNYNGEINESLSLPSYLEEVIIESSFIGIPNNIVTPISNGNITYDYSYGRINSNVIESYSAKGAKVSSGVSGIGSVTYSSANTTTFNYIGDYNSQGVPLYLEAERDQISATLLEYINASLPESQPVPQYHPTFLADGKKTTLDIIETADVWITFVHEGAGFRNAIGYYTYQTGTPPQSLNDIETINVIFPNLSFAGSGGGLYTGDKVNIGEFEAGISIGLVLMADGWDGNNSEDYKWKVLADKNLNPESDENLKQHNVLLWDEDNELFLLGFEDVRRDLNWCDQDFNDAILFVTSNPVEAISTDNVSPVDKPGTLDSDGDGINDVLDEYPNDPNKAYDSYYPSSTSYGTFAFEDNWPDFGDYDFNDLVVDYRFKHILNGENKVVQMEPTFLIRAVGAGYRNGFGFATNLLPSDIKSTSGHTVNGSAFTLNANGTEANQTNAVFLVANNVHDHFATSGFVNTEMGSQYFEPAEITLTIEFNSAKSYGEIGSVPYNPFMVISQDRGREVHLPGYAPTDLVDTDLFGTLDDNSDPDSNIYYRSRTALPWGIHLPESFDYPIEKADIRSGHLRFTDWSISYGYSYLDWYRSQNGYRNQSHLYSR